MQCMFIRVCVLACVYTGSLETIYISFLEIQFLREEKNHLRTEGTVFLDSLEYDSVTKQWKHWFM